MRERWSETLRARAAAVWTPAHTRATLGDKRLPLMPTEAPELLRALGLMRADGTIPPERIRKYRQINHMLGVLRPALVELTERFETVHLLDAGCGRSYLTLLVAWWFEHSARHPARILGVDRSPAVVQTSREHAATAALGPDDTTHVTLTFRAAPLEDLELDPELSRLDALLSLHACDTATDDALVLALSHDAAFIAVAPCCQRELSAAWKDLADEADASHALAGVWQSPHLRRTTAATLTDTFRLLLLQAHGYEASATEFVEAHHTPKNTLIRAMRRSEADARAAEQYRALVEATGGVEIGLAGRLG